jgi:hypothetical protein
MFLRGSPLISGRKVAVVDGDGCRHVALAVGGDAVEAASWHFGNEAVAPELQDQA